MNTSISAKAVLLALIMLGASGGWAFLPPARAPLPNLDLRGPTGAGGGAVTAGQSAAAAELRARLPKARVDFDEVTGAPAMVSAVDGLLTGAQGQGPAITRAALASVAADDPHRVTRAFLAQHSALFGFGPEALDKARIKRDFVGTHNGLRTVVWEQQVEGVPVFGGVLISHTTKDGELVNLSSKFVPDAAQAANRGLPNGSALVALAISAAQAAALAAQNVGEDAQAEAVTAAGEPDSGPEKAQKFKAPFLVGETSAKLAWLPVDKGKLRLCWDVILTGRKRGEMFRVLVDAQTGEVLVRHCLTQYISDATYSVFTSDSPSPFSPGYSTPQSTQPVMVSRTLVTLSALNTNASPNGWINDGGNETLGNNVDAHADRNNDDLPDLPRPQGSPFRVFDFPMDLTTQDPTNYIQAAVVQLFYLNNWMHDKLYELGFTEAAGNFQSNNFGRGGLGGDAVQADAQDGGGTDNANFSTPPDGSPGRMQMYIFTGPSPRRDGDLDAEVVLHEYTHGLSNRRVGGGVGISALQPEGMGEGWSDFYAMALLSEPGDNVNGCYASGAYASYLLSTGFTTNYYFGIRRYPYTTDMTKNPLTFKDIDPTQASAHRGIPRSPAIGTTANEVHNMGEVWCVTLWEARASLISKLGYAAGNHLILQLVTDGMNLSPVNPNFLQARDAIIQADLVDNGGANRADLWAAFAKRGMGASATSPASSTTTGLVEAYDVPDALLITPATSLISSGPVGGPFTPNPAYFTLTNSGSGSLTWSLVNTSAWLTVLPTSGTLIPGGAAVSISVSVGSAANGFPLGIYPVVVWFTNQASGVTQGRTFALNVVGRSMFDDFDPGIDLSQWSSFGGVLGTTVVATNYGGYISPPNSLWFGDAGSRFATTFPINTSSGGTISFYIRLADGTAWPWEQADALPGEGVVLEYSTDGGSTWTVMGSYDTTAYYVWTAVTLPVPAGAQAPAAHFRWRQKSHSGSSFDHWALDNVTIDAGPTPPSILTQPANQMVALGWNTAFTVVAAGSTPLAYQWRLNGNDLSGATTNPLTLVNVQSNQAGSYSVVVTNAYGSVTSTPAQLRFADRSSLVAVFVDPVYIDMTSGSTSAEGVNVQASLTNLGYAITTFTNISAAAATNNVLLFPEQEIRSLASYLTTVTQAALSNFVAQGGLLVVHGGENGAGSLIDTVFGLAVTELAQIGSGPTYSLTAQAAGTVFAGGPATVPCNNGTSTLTNLPAGALSIYDNAGLSAVALIPFGSGTIVFLGFDWYNALPIGAQDGGWLQLLGKAVTARSSMAPMIATQPASQTVVVGDTATFAVQALGSMPLSYQWRFNGTNLAGASASSLVLPNVKFARAGTYAVQVTNAYGSTNSVGALLAINPPPPCAPPPLGLVSWWRAEGNVLDQAGTNNGTLRGAATFAQARVGQGFALDGTNSYVEVPSSPELKLAGPFTAETWVNYDHLYGPYGSTIFAKGQDIEGSVDLALSISSGYKLRPHIYVPAGWTYFDCGTTLLPGVWYHVAMVYDGSTLCGYVNGALDGTLAVSGLVQTTDYSMRIGAYAPLNGTQSKGFFPGTIDELSFYSRALTVVEIQAIYAAERSGKCSAPTPPTILLQPTNQVAIIGDSGNLSVIAAGTQPLSYQWRLNGTNLNATTTSSLVFTNVQVSDSGTYSVFLSNSVGTLLSSNAILSVNPPPPCAAPPLGLVSWWRAEGNALDQAGTNDGTLVANTTYGPGRVGQVFVFDGASSHIDFGPTVGNFGTNAFTVEFWLRSLSSRAEGILGKRNICDADSFFDILIQQGKLVFVVDGDTSSYGFLALHDTTAVADGGFHHAALVRQGATLLIYVNGALSSSATHPQGQVAGIANAASLIAGRSACTGVDGTQWYSGALDEISLYNRALTAVEIQAIYNAERSGKCTAPTAPVILLQPTNQMATAGDNISFGVIAAGTEPLSFQWRLNGTNLAAATTSSLVFTNVQVSDSGTYSVFLSNSVGTLLSSNAIVTVHPAPLCAAPPVGLISWWRAEGDASDIIGGNHGTLSNGVSFVPGRAGQAFSLNGNNQCVRIPYSPTLIATNYSFEAWVNPLTQVSDAINQDLLFGQNYGAVQMVARTGTTGVRIAFQFGVSQYTFYEVVSTNEIPIGQFSHLVGTWDGTTLRLYMNGILNAQSVPGAAPVDSGCDFFIGGFSSSEAGYCNYVGQFFNGLIDEASFYGRALLPDEVQALYGAERSGKCTAPTPPIILLQPTNQIVTARSNAVFNVIAAGTSPLAYQWRLNGDGLPGETNTILRLTAVTASQSGSYDVVITNTVGAATSAVAVLTVYVPPPPLITQQPQSQAVPAGTNVTFTIMATDTWPITCQWYFGAAALPGATNTTLNLTDVQAANGGDYTVLAANPWSTATSAVATLTVVPTAPFLTLQPQSAAVFAGFPAQLGVAATGTEPLSYQWQFYGTNTPGATSTSYVVSNMAPANVGPYLAIVSNSVGTTTSAPARLALSPVASWGATSIGLTALPIGVTNAGAVSAGAQHSLALRRDGAVVAWGAADQAIIPKSLTNIVAISAGSDYSAALKADGTVVAWGGDSTAGQTNVPANLSNVVAVAAGSSHSLALKADGTVVAWGLNTSGQTTVPFGLTNVVAISAGSNHSIALRADGKVFAWGNNTYGQTTVPSNLVDVVAIAAGATHNLALRSDGTVAAWGASTYGRTNVPAGLSNVIAIAAGGFHSLAVKSDGTLVAWGAGTNSVALTYPTLGQSFIPPTVTNVTAVSGGDAHTLALAGDGPPFITAPPVSRASYSGRRVVFLAAATGALPLNYQWQFRGADIPGATNQLLVIDSAFNAGNYRVVVTNALGVATSSSATLSLADSAPFVVSQPVGQPVFLGAQALLQVTADGSGPFFYQWRLNGTNIAGATNSSLLLNHLLVNQAGNYSVVVSNAFGAVSSAKAAVPVVQMVAWGAGTNYSGSPNYGQSVIPGGLNNAVATAGGEYHTVTVTADGKVQAWGAGTNYGTSPNYGQSVVPANLPAAVGVAGGYMHSLAVRADGLVAAWGAGTSNSPAPNYGQCIVPAGLSNVVAVAAGDYHSVALKSDGKVAVWGYNSYSQTNVPTTATNVVRIASRVNHVLALRSDGSVVHWGSLTTLPPTPYNYVAIAAGVNHCLALRNDGTVVSWGGSYPVPTGLSNVVDIAAGYDHSVALKNDGTVVTWGATNTYGRNLIPTGLTNVIGVACGIYHSLAVLGDGSPLVKFPPANRAAYLGTATNFSVMALGAQPLRYQWQCNGTDIPGATNASLALTNLQAADAGNYRVVVTNVYSSVTSAVATLTVLVPLGQALDAPGLVWSTSGNAAWAGESSVTHAGVDAAQSGLLTDSQSSSVQTTVTGAGTLSFWWKVSSEEWFDYLTFYIDGLKQAAISGEVDWQQQTFAVGNGSHTLKWTYAKDPSVGVGADAGWLDQVTFITNPPVITVHPVSQQGTMGAALMLSVAASGAPPITYQWLKDGTNLSGASSMTYVIPKATRRDSGVYQAVASNPGGGTPSSNATLVVRSPQKLGPPVKLPSGGFVLTSSDADGGPLVSGDLPSFQVQATTNFVDWVALLNSLTVSNGMLLLLDPDSTNYPFRFYRIIELDDATFVTNPPVITVHPLSQTVTMGARVQLTVAGVGGPPLRYQWLKDGTNLAGATTTSLTISNATRHSSGVYVAVVSNPVGGRPSSNATVLVRVPEKLGTPLRLAEGTFALLAGDADGGLLLPSDLLSFQAQVSTNLLNWVTLTNGLTLTNGMLLLRDADSGNRPARFYRIIEP